MLPARGLWRPRSRRSPAALLTLAQRVPHGLRPLLSLERRARREHLLLLPQCLACLTGLHHVQRHVARHLHTHDPRAALASLPRVSVRRLVMHVARHASLLVETTYVTTYVIRVRRHML